ncbi:MAG: hypothetical protein FJ303_04885 [Planctomycetes bacterium]|nr:hypothetical protein [Planctomycetota bacterium]
MTEPLAFLNGRLLAQSQAHLTLHDAGFVFGATVTDLCRTFRHKLYRFEPHLARFRASCRSASIDLAFDDATITDLAKKLIQNNAELVDAKDDLALVLFATPGPVGFYLGEPTRPGEKPTFGMHTYPLPFTRYRPWIEHGIALATPRVRAAPTTCVDPHIKQRSRMHWWLAECETRRTNPGAQALLLDLAGNITETASANVVLVKNGVLVAPPLGSVLEGVSLGVVSDFAAALGLGMERRSVTLADCYAADEAILTCTTYCIAGVRQINHQAIQCPGPILERLHTAWSAEVGLDIHGQILGSP